MKNHDKDIKKKREKKTNKTFKYSNFDVFLKK